MSLIQTRLNPYSAGSETAGVFNDNQGRAADGSALILILLEVRLMASAYQDRCLSARAISLNPYSAGSETAGVTKKSINRKRLIKSLNPYSAGSETAGGATHLPEQGKKLVEFCLNPYSAGSETAG